MGGAIFLSGAQSAFTNELIRHTEQLAPHLSPVEIVATGATEIRHVFKGTDLEAVITSYMSGIKTTLLISVVLAGASVLTSALVPWTSVKGKPAAGVGMA